LVEQAKLRSVISEVDEYKTAVSTFKGIYDYLPGDMPDADSYWATCITDASHTYNVCNGNADDKLTFLGGTNPIESYRAWQHLSLAGIISGNYIGIDNVGAGQQANIGANVPESSFGGGGYSFNFITPYNKIQLGKFRTNDYASFSIMTPSQTYNIDNKIDDESHI